MALTQERLKELLHYDQETGVFTWISRVAKHTKIGDVAGYRGQYIFIRIEGELHRAHRLAWLYVYGEWPNQDIDHKNRDKHDNSIANLRLATDSENLFNASLRSDNTSGHRGVSWSERDKVWRTYISQGGGKHVSLGQFRTRDEAVAARKAAEESRGIFIYEDAYDPKTKQSSSNQCNYDSPEVDKVAA